jgi:hypothetical protein
MKASTIGVIPEADVLDEAYRMGYTRFEDAETVDEEDSDALEGLSHYKEMASYINNVAPRLRALAGYVDSGPGTYQVERKVVVVPHHAQEDVPRDGKLMAIRYVHEAVQDAFDRGALDAMQGRDYGETDDVSLT